jgi:hypothetical protein
MKKSKKFLSMLLATAMTVSMAVMPAFADNETGETPSSEPSTSESEKSETSESDKGVIEWDKENSISTLTFKKVVKTNGVKIIPNAEFDFIMKPYTYSADSTDKTSKMTYYPGPVTSNFTYDTDGDGKNDAYKISAELKGTNAVLQKKVETITSTEVPGLNESSVEGILLDTMSFTLPGVETFKPGDEDAKAGIYSYEVYEEMPAGQDATITMDSTHFIVDLYVNSEGKVTYVQSKVSNTNKKPIVFENNVETADLIIKKKVNDGASVEDGKQFTFWMKIPAGGDSIDLLTGDKITGTKTSGNTNSKVEITVGGSKTQEEGEDAKNTTSADNGWCSFTLGSGEYVTFENLPAGMIYYLFENDYTSENFTTYFIAKQGEAIAEPTKDTDYKVTEFKDGDNKEIYLSSAQSDYHQLGAGQNGVFYLNNFKKLETADTGITVDILPYAVVVLAVVAAFAVLMVSKKRRNVR